jgi:hypothetical protein
MSEPFGDHAGLASMAQPILFCGWEKSHADCVSFRTPEPSAFAIQMAPGGSKGPKPYGGFEKTSRRPSGD